jgi:hypothetical protein
VETGVANAIECIFGLQNIVNGCNGLFGLSGESIVSRVFHFSRFAIESVFVFSHMFRGKKLLQIAIERSVRLFLAA